MSKAGSGTPAHLHGYAASHTPAANPLFTHTSPTPSPRRAHFPNGPAGPGSPRGGRSHTPVLPSIGSSTEQDNLDSPSRRTNLIMGFSPGSSAAALPPVSESTSSTFIAGSPSRHPLALNVTSSLARLSPQLSTPIDQTFFPEGSPRTRNSPRPWPYELPPRSRRNSAAIVSISLSSRSRSRTPRGDDNASPGQASGAATPNKGSSNVTPKNGETRMVQMGTSRMNSSDVLDEWQPAGGMLLDDDDAIDDDDDDHDDGRVWSGLSEPANDVDDVLKPGMVFGEGLKFQGAVIVPAIGREGTDDAGLPLRRGGSEVGKKTRSTLGPEVKSLPVDKRQYEVVRKLGSGSYAVVYLVRETGGRRREYALKCLSKANLEEEQIETQLFEAHIHLSLPIHTNIVTLHQTLQTEKWLFLMLELCPGEDLFYWLEKSRDASPPPHNARLREEPSHPMSSSKFSASSIPFSSSAMFSGLASHMPMSMSMSSSFSNSPTNHFSPAAHGSPASLLFAHHNGHHSPQLLAQTPPTPSLLSAFSANTLLSPRRLRLIASMFAQMCEAVAVCHEAGVSHRDIKPENFICCDSVELETVREGDDIDGGFGPQAKRKVVVKLTDFGLATTEEESGDVECGSRPYMAYEARNNLGPTYFPAPADVWSLGIVLINMLFHRNPWKDPCEGDVNFDKFLNDPTFFLISKFTGIGREVANFIANHILCVDVGDRATARDFGKWIKGLPEMIGGRRAVKDLKKVNAAVKTNGLGMGDHGLFIKSPVQTQTTARKISASALTSSAPAPIPIAVPEPIVASTAEAPRLSSLPPPSEFAMRTPTPELEPEQDDPNTASTIDGQPTPTDLSAVGSPAQSDLASILEPMSPTAEGDDARSTSTNKRKKRGIRKGKAAQAALAAANGEGTSQAERDALLAELANASQSLARDLSKFSSPTELDASNTEHFPPLGTTPAQLAAAKKSKWKDMMKFSSTSGNPELAALARRVAERDSESGGNWSAPAKLQDDHRAMLGGGTKSSLKQTATFSSEVSSVYSTFEPGPVSASPFTSGTALPSSMGSKADDWRVRREPEGTVSPFPVPTATVKADKKEKHDHREKEKDSERDERAKKAALAAAALTGNIGPMGSFGKPPLGVPRHGPLHGRHIASSLPPPQVQQAPSAATPISLVSPSPVSSVRISQTTGPSSASIANLGAAVPRPIRSNLSHGPRSQAMHFGKSPTAAPKLYTPPAHYQHSHQHQHQHEHQSQQSFPQHQHQYHQHQHSQPHPSQHSLPSGPAPPPASLLSLQSHKTGPLGAAHSVSASTAFTSSVDSTRLGSLKDTNTIISLDSPSETTAFDTLAKRDAAAAVSPNKPKLKGQIQSLAKMLSGLKTSKGKD